MVQKRPKSLKVINIKSASDWYKTNDSVIDFSFVYNKIKGLQ